MITFVACGANNQKDKEEIEPVPQENEIRYSLNGLVKQASLGFDTDSLTDWSVTDEYSLNASVVPVWNSKNIYRETVSFIGQDDVATLMYTPTRIVKVYDYYLQKEYVENEDFIVSGNTIKLTENTGINFWERKDYYYAGPQGAYELPTDKGYLKFSEVVPNTHQISVYYEHDGKYMGKIPVGQSDKFAFVNDKVKNGGTLNICVIGDSITKGCGSSGYIMTSESARNSLPGGDPYKIAFPSYINLVKDFIESKGVTVNLCNTAVGGTGVSNGMYQIGQWTITPDLAIIAFGMNDAKVDVDTFKEKTRELIEKVRELNSQCEILLVSSMIPNPDIIDWLGNIAAFEEKSLLPLLSAYDKIGLSPMTSVSESIYKSTGKKFEDINSNSVNHPNDFLHGIYAQTALTVIFGEGYNK